jgi:hypothetical protein
MLTSRPQPLHTHTHTELITIYTNEYNIYSKVPVFGKPMLNNQPLIVNQFIAEDLESFLLRNYLW